MHANFLVSFFLSLMILSFCNNRSKPEETLLPGAVVSLVNWLLQIFATSARLYELNGELSAGTHNNYFVFYYKQLLPIPHTKSNLPSKNYAIQFNSVIHFHLQNNPTCWNILVLLLKSLLTILS